MTQSELRERKIELEGCHNLRDIGGYATLDGRTTRWGQVYRSDGLSRLPLESQEKLLARGIHAILDLRHPAEIKNAPNVFAESSAVIYLGIPLLEDQSADWSAIGQTTLDLWTVNQLIIDRQNGLKQVFEFLTTAEFPVLIHCSGGKDRTGLVIALLLGLLNVPEETIVEDYSLSEGYLAPFFEQARTQMEAAGLDATKFEHLLASRPELMQRVLAYLRDQFGGVISYLAQLGVSEQQLTSLRERLIELPESKAEL